MIFQRKKYMSRYFKNTVNMMMSSAMLYNKAEMEQKGFIVSTEREKAHTETLAWKLEENMRQIRKVSQHSEED